MEEILQVVKREVDAREISEGVKIYEHKNTDGNEKNLTPMATGLLVRDGHLSNTKKCCVFCKGDHYSASCEWVNTTVDQRKVLLKEGHCFLCLTSGYCANQCSSKQKCRKCNQKHHQSLCEQGTMPNTEGENKSDTVPKTTVAVGKSKANVLLQTARTFAYSVDEELISVRVLLDNGSQHSYITNDLSARLGLKPIKLTFNILSMHANSLH